MELVPSPKKNTSDFISEKELAQRLGVGTNTLRRWRRAGRGMPPSVQLGKLIKFHRAEVDAWIEKAVAGEVRVGGKPKADEGRTGK